MAEYFPGINKIDFEGSGSKNPLAFKHYDPKQVVLGKTMAEHLRFAVCYWHSFKGAGLDPFGAATLQRSYNNGANAMAIAENTMHAAFEFFQKLGVGFWCFHDTDIAPEGATLAETNANVEAITALAKTLQDETGIKLLWGTSNCFSHPRFMSGAGTAPSLEVFSYAAAQIKRAIDATHALNGEGYVFWGGREGYETLLNTDMGQELDHLAALLHMAVDYKNKIGFKGQFYIEPKPKEPTKHQYDSDAAACYAFLQKYDLVDDFKLNIEANHATLAGHTFQHELEFCVANGILGSVDANRGDALLGWDTDQFPTDIYDTTLAMLAILKGGGFTTGGLNFDAKLRRQSTDNEDLFYAHIGAMDAFARGLKNAAAILEDGRISEFINERYASWKSELGKKVAGGKSSLEELSENALANPEPTAPSGRQEYLENIFNELMQ